MVVGGGRRRGLQDADKYFPEGFLFLTAFYREKMLYCLRQTQNVEHDKVLICLSLLKSNIKSL